MITRGSVVLVVAGAMGWCVSPVVGQTQDVAAAKAPPPLTIRSAAFAHRGAIPVKYTRDGEDVSPPLEFLNIPAGTKSLVLICEDPDAPTGNWVHWVLYDIPLGIRRLDENISRDKTVLGGAKQGLNDFQKIGYGGPAPPPGGPHRYFFKLYALDKETGLEAGATKEKVARSMERHILARAEIVGIFDRKPPE